MVLFNDLKGVTAKYKDELHEAVNRVVDSGWYLGSGENDKFEKDFAEYIGTKYCVGVGNGLDALYWIFRAYIEMGVMKPGDEVLVPANTFIASIHSITENGLVPVLVEPKQETLEIDDDKIEAAITYRTRGILLVHLYGRCAYTDKVGELCKKYNLKLVEDNAQAHGCMFKGVKTGALGDAAGHSFYPGKNLGAFGDAGAVTTNDEELQATVRALANYGSQKKYVFKYIGRNSRLDSLQAAVLDVKLKHLDEDNAHRKAIAYYYYDHINNQHVTLPVRMDDENNVYHIFPILCDRRDAMQMYLKDKGIQTLIHYPIAPHKQECYKDWNNWSLPISELLHQQELSLPMHAVLTMEEAKQVVDAINSFEG